MKLTRITARNFKGLTFDLALAPMTILVGENFAGKTARTDLIRWVLLGYLPELGETNRATFGLASGKDMEGTATFDTGLTIKRRLFLKGDTVKETVDMPEELQGCPLMGVMLNAEEYFQLSDRERIDYVFRNCPQEGEALTTEAIRSRLVTDLQPDDNGKAVIERVLAAVDDQAAGSLLENLVTAGAIVTREAREYAVRMEKTAQGLAGLKAADTAAPAPTADPEALARELAEVTSKITVLRQRADSARKNSRLHAELVEATATIEHDQAQLAALQASCPPPLLATQLDQERYDLTARIATLEAVRAGRAAQQARVDELTKQTANLPMLRETLKALDEQLAIPVPAAPEPGSAKIAVDIAGIEGQLSAARGKIDETKIAWETARRDLASVDTLQACPFCGATGEEWKTLKRAELNSEIDKIVARGKELRKAEQSVLQALSLKEAALTRVKEWEGRGDAARRAHAQFESQASSVRAQISGLEAKADELARIQPAGAVDQNTITALRTKKDALADQIAHIRAAEGTLRDLKHRVQTMQAQKAELDRLGPPEDADAFAAESSQLQKQQSDIGFKLEQVRTSMRAAAARQADAQRAAQAEQARDKAKAEQVFAGRLTDTLRTIQTEAVERAFKPMLDIANAFAKPVLRTPLAYHDGQIGTYRGGLWVGHRTFSGTEKAIGYAAIQAALANRAPVRIMLIDELGRIGDRRLFLLLAAISQHLQKSGLIDQFIGIDAGRLEYYQKHADSFACQVTEIK